MGLLVGILAIAAVGAVIAAILLTRRHDHTATPATTTVVVTKNAATPKTVVAHTTPAAPAAAPVPNLIGESTADATSSLKASGFTVRVATVRGAPPAGRVVGENPPPARHAAPGSIVTLDISNGTAVPSKSSAATTTVVTQTTTAPAAKTVPARSSPAATTAAATAPTAATSASKTTTATPQPTTATIPDVSGGDAQAAAQALSRANLLTSLAYVPSDDPLETVEAESPTAGANAPAGSHVTVNVSSGPGQKQQETVPDVSGKTIPQAVAAMQQAGLRLIFVKKPVNERSLAGTVVEQTPAAGRTAPKNAQILVYMGAFE
ncbi:MAG TPA: PASTA domain-containing protein [Gaiellaceae bacterium]|jgi:serine/threonine-protein kinase|nr:PASTA domain-containing protein [Gaiellaceae bacterium]